MVKPAISVLLGVIRKISTGLALLGGVAIAIAIALVLLEIALRNFANISLGGVDELGGYALAVGSALSFAYALVERAHVRVDTIYMYAGARLRGLLDLLAMAGVAAVAVTLAYHASTVWEFALAFNTRSMTPLQTPMWIPQGLWLIGLWWFAAVSVALLTIMVLLTLTGETAEAARIGGIGQVDEEVSAEVQDMQLRAAGQSHSTRSEP